MRTLLITFILLFLLFISENSNAQSEVSVAFSDGYLGTQGSNTQQANNIVTFSTLGIRSVSFSQVDIDSDGRFDVDGTQGNDVAGIIRLYLNSGSVISLNGALNWRETTGSDVEVFGFIFNSGQNASIAYSGGTYNIVGGSTTNTSTNIGLKSYFSSFTFVDNEDRSGNAATNNALLQALNTELTTTPSLTLSLSQSSANEGQNLVFTVNLSSTTSSELVKLFSFTGSATAGTDYNTTYTFSNGVTNNGDGTISIPSGLSSFTITVTTLNDDLVEGTETVILNLGNDSSTGNILDPDQGGFVGSNQTICPNTSPATLTTTTAAIGSSPSYQWQSSTDNSSFSNVASAGNGETYSPSNLIVTTYFRRNATIGGTTYTSNTVTITVLGSSSISWTGITNTTFGTSSNWNPTVSPTGCNVTIPGSLGSYPIINSNSSVGSLTIASGANLTLGISGNNIFSVTGAFENNGTINGTGTLIFSGSSTQSITGTGTIKNVDINNASGVTISSGSNKMNVNGVMTITTGTITTNDNLVFKASATEEGMIGQISTCATNANPIIGKVTVERYVPGSQRSFRFLTPGVTSTSSIRDNWQEGSNVTNANGYPNSSGLANPVPGYGTHITGSTTGEGGVDATITGNPSLFTYSASAQAWSSIINTTTPTFKVGVAYQIMVRGDRSIDMRTNTPTPNTTIIRTTGIPATCNFTFSPSTTVPLSSAATGFSFIGNPYWAIVNWHSVSKSGIENTLYYWDPTLAGSNSRGAYTTLLLDGSGNETRSNNSSRVSKYLQPGQGFFVRNTNTTPSITFTESDKINNNSNKAFIFQKNPLNAELELGIDDKIRVRGGVPATEKLYVSLYLKSNTNKSSADGIALTYNKNFSDGPGPEDARKFTNLDENLAVALNGVRFAITGMQSSSLVKSDTIPLTMWNLNDIDYVLRFDLTSYLEPQREIFLLNRTTGQTTKLNNKGILDVEFRPNTSVRSKDDLAIVFNSTRIIPAPRKRKRAEVFPNPVTNGVVQFSVPYTDFKSSAITRVNLELQDQSGRLVSGGIVQVDNNGNGQLDISDLPTGIYSFKILVGAKVYINKIVKH